MNTNTICSIVAKHFSCRVHLPNACTLFYYSNRLLMLFAFYTYRFDSIRFGRARKNRMLDFQIRWKWTSRNLLRLTFFFFSFYIFIYIAARLPYAICSTITTNVRFDGSLGKQISIKLFSAPKYADEIINTECCELSWKRQKKWRWAGKKIESICKEKESHELEMSIFDRVGVQDRVR